MLQADKIPLVSFSVGHFFDCGVSLGFRSAGIGGEVRGIDDAFIAFRLRCGAVFVGLPAQRVNPALELRALGFGGFYLPLLLRCGDVRPSEALSIPYRCHAHRAFAFQLVRLIVRVVCGNFQSVFQVWNTFFRCFGYQIVFKT